MHLFPLCVLPSYWSSLLSQHIHITRLHLTWTPSPRYSCDFKSNSEAHNNTLRELTHNLSQSVDIAHRYLPYLNDFTLCTNMQLEPDSDRDDDEDDMVLIRLQRSGALRQAAMERHGTDMKHKKEKKKKKKQDGQSQSSKHLQKDKDNKSESSSSSSSSSSIATTTASVRRVSQVGYLILMSDDPVQASKREVERTLLPTLQSYEWTSLYQLKVDSHAMATIPLLQPIITTAINLRQLNIDEPMADGLNGLLRLLARYSKQLQRIGILFAPTCPLPEPVSIISLANGCRDLRHIEIVHSNERTAYDNKMHALAVKWYQSYVPSKVRCIKKRHDHCEIIDSLDEKDNFTYSNVCCQCYDDGEVRAIADINSARASIESDGEIPSEIEPFLFEYPLNDTVLDALHQLKSLIYVDLSAGWFTTRAIVRLVQALPALAICYLNDVPCMTNYTVSCINTARSTTRLPSASYVVAPLAFEITGSSVDLPQYEIKDDKKRYYPFLSCYNGHDPNTSPYQAAMQVLEAIGQVNDDSDNNGSDHDNNDNDDGEGDDPDDE
jgi:hypothetical protein